MYMMTLRHAGYTPLPFLRTLCQEKNYGVRYGERCVRLGAWIKEKKLKENTMSALANHCSNMDVQKCVLVNDDPAVCCLLFIAV